MSGTTTQFLYDSGNVSEELQGTTVTAQYSAAAEKLNGTVYWMLQDGQGSTRQLLNSAQSIVQSYTADSFGNSVSSSGTVSSNPLKWNGGSGYYSDSESGLQKVGARYYDPQVGTWISQDTLLIAGSPADSQSLNRYLYCRANPVGRMDPGGHDDEGPRFSVLKVVPACGGVLGAVLVISVNMYYHAETVANNTMTNLHISSMVLDWEQTHGPIDTTTKSGQYLRALINGDAIQTGAELGREGLDAVYHAKGIGRS